MKRNEALLKIVEKVGSQAEVARRIGVDRRNFNDWLLGKVSISGRYVNKLVALSNGEVKASDLRPDLFYDYTLEEKKELRMAAAWS